MFNVLPGDGLGTTASRILAYGLGFGGGIDPENGANFMAQNVGDRYEVRSIPTAPDSRGIDV